MPALIEGADLKRLVQAGEDVTSLEAHVVPGKVTVFDFYANWCAACRNVDRHMIGLLNKRSDLAHRRLNVISWETPIAARYLQDVPGLPLLIVYGKNGKRVATIAGADLEALDRAIASGEKQ
jgi:thiol-disulfide isomerase/thioredoxin